MANQTTHDQAQTLDETLNKTELGHVINENKKGILIAGAVLVVVIIGISIFKYQANQSEKQNLNEAYAFQTSVIEPFMTGKIEAEEAVNKIQNIDSDLAGSANLAPSIFEAVGKLVEEGKVEEAISVLDEWHQNFESGSYLKFFSGLRLAPLLENAGKKDEAIAVYEGLVKGGHNLLEARIYLDLGRLYTEKGQNEKAKSFFDHIIKNHESSEEAKFARLYLQKLNK